jgi:hypothetical protein
LPPLLLLLLLLLPMLQLRVRSRVRLHAKRRVADGHAKPVGEKETPVQQ